MKQILFGFLFTLFMLPLMAASAPSCRWVHGNRLQVKSKNLIESGSFVRSRSYYMYLMAFGSQLSTELENLSPDSVWVDMGAGSGHALRDFSEFQTQKNQALPHLVGISKEASPGFDPESKSIVWLGGRFYEDIPAEFLPSKYDVVTDYYGILSYTSQVSEYLNSVFARLPIGGKFFAVISNGDQIRKSESFMNRFFGQDSLLSYLKSTDNIEVQTLKARRGAPLGSTVLLITKTGPVKFSNLKLQNYNNGTPPKRTFTVDP